MNYSVISKYRGHIMGVATMWIALLHASMWFPIEPINWIKLTGQGGVDIFLFLSAFGLYYSYQNDNNNISFWKKRFMRIFPIFIPLALLRWYYNDYSFDQGIMMITTSLFWITGDRSTWYISAIVPLYFIAPFYLRNFDKRSKLYTIIAIVVSFIVSIFFFSGPYIVFFARVPVFFLGFYAGKLAYHQKEISKKAWVIQSLLFIVGFGLLRWAFVYTNETILWNYGLYWFPMLFAAWPFCLFLAVIFKKLDELKIPVITSCFKKIGIVTLEFYLLHDLMIKFFTNILTINPLYSAYGIVLNVLVIFATYYLALYVHEAMAWIMKNVRIKQLVNMVIVFALLLVGVKTYGVLVKGNNEQSTNNDIAYITLKEEANNMTFTVEDKDNSAELNDFIINNPDLTFQTKHINGIPVIEAFKDDGEKKPLVFLLHGLNGYKESYGYLLSVLAKNGYHAVAFDAASHGARNDGQHYFYEIVVQTGHDCELLLSYFAQDPKVNVEKYGVVGFSMGGMSSYWLSAYGNHKPTVIAPIASTPNYLDIQQLYLTDTLVEQGVSYDDASKHEEMINNLTINNPINNIEGFAGVSTIICHGKNDELISYTYDEAFYHQLTEKGYSTKLYLFDTGHVIPSKFVPVLVEELAILK
ncbi:MAG: alpha/beta fold hydrolase [Erysipelotrichaceae bacterium]|nr:alpha/beta fold hydrolase [Erysipelotrichaceae bacterium]MDY5252431.1 alpha/beta fold hydrolase [Erysipelotrichaceae bacterium]